MSSTRLHEVAGSIDADAFNTCSQQAAAEVIGSVVERADIQNRSCRVGSARLVEGGEALVADVLSRARESWPLPLRIKVPLSPPLYPMYKWDVTVLIPPELLRVATPPSPTYSLAAGSRPLGKLRSRPR